jgi:hypothetical protein
MDSTPSQFSDEAQANLRRLLDAISGHLKTVETLNREEKKAIRKLQELADKWPETLKLSIVNGHVMVTHGAQIAEPVVRIEGFSVLEDKRKD